MTATRKVMVGLRVITAATVLVGIVGMVGAAATDARIPLFPGVSVPGWVLGASVVYMGVRYWLRLPELQRRLGESAGFSWANFKSKAKEC